MTFTHEAGHLVGGWIGGGTLRDVELRPWQLPYSQFRPDPYPRLTLWAGPILGVIVPLFAAAMIRRRWAHFIADFCLLANGTYMALAWFSGAPQLDTPRLLQEGARPVAIAIYCIITIGFGYVRFRRDCAQALGETSPPS